MSTIRVFELAKHMGAPVSEVLKQADALGIEVYSPLTTLEPDDAKSLRKQFEAIPSEKLSSMLEENARQRAAKQAEASSRREARNKAERAILEANRLRAIEVDARVKGKSVEPESAAKVEKLVAAEAVEAVAATPTVAAEGVAPDAKAEPAVAPAKAAEKPVVKPAAKGVDKVAGAPAAKPVATKPGAVPAKPAAVGKPAVGAKPAAGTKPVAGAKPMAVPRVPERRGQHDRDGDRGGEQFGRRGRGDQMRDKGGRRDQRERPGMPPQGGRQQPQRGAAGAPARGTEGAVAPEKVIYLRSSAVVVKDLAELLGLRPNRLIADLMQLNILASINQRVEMDVAQKVADKYGYKVELERQKRSTERRPVLRSEDADDAIPEDRPEDMIMRPPVVTFLGHVDHGKTSLMDRVRNTRVVAGEAGGITQHIGAYTVDINGRKITFLDTPGHAAFSNMRARGASLTDIAVIIIAADDGVMPQTREAIKHAQQAGVQLMVAINKCDLPTAKPDRVRQMLQAEGLTPEEWGGDTICVEVSAMTGDGVDHLLEMILLQADMLELTANSKRRANGYVIEAQLEQGLGPTATLLISGGTLQVGDIVLCGEYFGRIRGLINDCGRRVKSVGPAMAVKCMGLSGVPEAGAEFRVMLNDRRAKELAEQVAEQRKHSELSSAKATSLDALMSQIQENQRLELGLIIKADTQGSAEAIVDSLNEIKSEKVSLNIIGQGIGNVSATDVNKAAPGNALVVGFSVGCEAGVQPLARHLSVRINTFRIIYDLLDFVKQRMLDLLPPEYKEVVKGHAEIRASFDIGKTGRIAGCQMMNGTLLASGHYRILRKKEKIWEGQLASLKHFQNETTEVTGSQECGIHFKGFEGFQVGDVVECYVLEELPRAL